MAKESATPPMERDVLLASLNKRYKAAKGLADLWASILEASFHYAVPFRNRFYRPVESQGEQKNARLFDTTLVEATNVFVSKLQDTMTPPQVQWGFLEIGDTAEELEDDDKNQMQLMLDDYMRRLFTFIRKSNFDVVINECYFDLAIGTASIVINQYTDEEPLLFTSIPIDKLCIEEAANGKIESWFRTWDNLKISELNTRWKNIEPTSEMRMQMLADPDARVQKIYEGVAYYPNRDKPYCYAVWSGDGLLLTEWLESNPGIVWRFQKTNNETWGRGPVMAALPSMISLNEMARIDLASANLNVFKPYMGFSDAVFNPHTFTLEPFSIIPIAPIGSGGQAPLIPLGDSSNPQFAQITVADLRMQILKLMFADQPQDSQSIQPQTNYELALRQQTLAQKIGPLFSRLQQEFLWPVIKRISYILDKMGKLPLPKFKGVPVEFVYRSPLALAKAQQDVARFTQFIQILQGTIGADSAMVYINTATTPYLLAEGMQVDSRYLNNPKKVAETLQNLQNKQNEMEMAGMEQAQPAAQPVSQVLTQ